MASPTDAAALEVYTARQGKPLCIDLFCGLGGWAEGFLAEGYDVIGFDIERHDYGTGGYPGQLVLQDVLTLDGRQFRNAAVIVASPPCQAYSYRAMPFGGLWLEHNRMDDDGGPAGNYQGKDPIFNDLFRACFRIAREAKLPIVIENVKGAQKFMGRAAWHHGSFYLWGDVPALMPITLAQRKGCGGTWFTSQNSPDTRGQVGNPVSVPSGIKGTGATLKSGFNTANARRWKEEQANGVKCTGQKNGTEYAMTRGPADDGRKRPDGGDGTWFGSYAEQKARGTISPGRLYSSKSDSRKAASAQIAKIPFPLAQHIARVFKP